MLAELAEQRGVGVLLAGGLAGFAAAVMMVVVRRAGALLVAELLDILLDGGEIRLGSRHVARFQILRQLRNGRSQRIAALRA